MAGVRSILGDVAAGAVSVCDREYTNPYGFVHCTTSSGEDFIMIVCIDPDTKLSGVAWFLNGILLDAGLTKEPVDRYGVKKCYCELPEVQFGRTKNPKDIVALAIAAGKVTALLPDVTWLTTRQWKGQLSKAVCHARAWAVLLASEKKIIEDYPTNKNTLLEVMDAVSMGLKVLGRLHPQNRSGS